MRVTIWVLAIALFAALGGQSQAQQQDAKPIYCAAPGAYRLSECGLTEKEALAAEAAAAAQRTQARASKPSEPLTYKLLEKADRFCLYLKRQGYAVTLDECVLAMIRGEESGQ